MFSNVGTAVFFWLENFIYTGTPYALHRKVNQRNFGTGMCTRLAVIPLPDEGMVQRHQEVIEGADEFKTQQFMDSFGTSQPAAWKAINRLVSEGFVEKVKYGLYRKLVQELP